MRLCSKYDVRDIKIFLGTFRCTAVERNAELSLGAEELTHRTTLQERQIQVIYKERLKNIKGVHRSLMRDTTTTNKKKMCYRGKWFFWHLTCNTFFVAMPTMIPDNKLVLYFFLQKWKIQCYKLKRKLVALGKTVDVMSIKKRKNTVLQKEDD